MNNSDDTFGGFRVFSGVTEHPQRESIGTSIQRVANDITNIDVAIGAVPAAVIDEAGEEFADQTDILDELADKTTRLAEKPAKRIDHLLRDHVVETISDIEKIANIVQPEPIEGRQVLEGPISRPLIDASRQWRLMRKPDPISEGNWSDCRCVKIDSQEYEQLILDGWKSGASYESVEECEAHKWVAFCPVKPDIGPTPEPAAAELPTAPQVIFPRAEITPTVPAEKPEKVSPECPQPIVQCPAPEVKVPQLSLDYDRLAKSISDGVLDANARCGLCPDYPGGIGLGGTPLPITNTIEILKLAFFLMGFRF